MKVLFLDFDGVLNTENYVRKQKRSGIILDPAKMILLKEIVNNTNIYIVIHTSWRCYWSKKECHPIGDIINDIFSDYGLMIFDKTKDSLSREDSLLDYLSRHPDIKDYVILDDALFHHKEIIHHHIHTSSFVGLTKEDVNNIVERIGRII